MTPKLVRAALVLVALVAASAELRAQRSKGPRNAPENCAWCGGDPEVMAKAGIVSHGGFPFAETDTADVDAHFAAKDIYWIESAHYRIGLTLDNHKVSPDESKKIRAELTELAQVLPRVDPKTRVLEPFMRTHLYAHRAEKLWKRFLEVMRVEESTFPDGRSVWLLGTPYFGEGPYLGQKEKFELLVLPTAGDQVPFLKKQFGLSIARTQRWNVIERSALLVVTNLMENDLTDDQRLHGHVVFNLAINMLDGYEHYAYDTPRWLTEGIGHFMEREINPRFNTFDASEGSAGVKVNKSDWDAEVNKLIASDEAPRLAEMIALRTYAEFEMRHHYACWSMTRFMIEEHPEGYACLNAALHGRKTPDGMPDSQDMPGVQRAAFQDCFGMNYMQFDEAWRAWAVTQ
jgi:hypothetical protein